MFEVRSHPPKRRGTNADVGAVEVTFAIPARPDVHDAAVVGDFNDWSTTATSMTRVEETFTATVTLEAGRRYRFKYLLNGERWENDWAADDYVPNGHGGDDSVIDLEHPRRPLARATRHTRPPSGRQEWVPGPRADLRFEADRRALAELLRKARAIDWRAAEGSRGL